MTGHKVGDVKLPHMNDFWAGSRGHGSPAK